MKQRIEPPNAEDTESVARQIVYAEGLVKQATGGQVDGSRRDLALLQSALKGMTPDRTYDLQSLGLLFGRAFLRANEYFDWWMVEDDYGRDPALRYKQTSLLLFPLTMISKRIEDGREVDVTELFDGLCGEVEQIRRAHYQE